MKKVLCALMVLVSNITFAGELKEIVLKTPIQVKGESVLKAANFAMHVDTYWEDEGYEFKTLEESTDVQITKLYQDENGRNQKLELQGVVTVGGYGWFEGYREGMAYCTITLEKVDGEYKSTRKNAFAECEIEYYMTQEEW